MDGSEELPSGWAWARLDELGHWTGGGTPSKAKAEFWTGGTVPWVSPKDMKADRVGRAAERITDAAVRGSAAKLVPSESVLCVVRSGILQHTFPVALAECDVTLNQDMRALTTHPGINPGFVRLFLRSNNDRILHECAKEGTTVASINADRLGALAVPVAPAGEQDRVVAQVEALFADLNEAEAALGRARDALADYRASLLHAACTGALTAAWRAANPRPAEDGPALLRRILAERRAAWERAELARLIAKGKPTPKGESWKARYEEPCAPDLTDMPELPSGWVWASLDQLSRDSSYGTSAKSEVAGRGVPVLRIPNVQTGRVDWSNLKFATTDLGLVDGDHLTAGDLLVVRTNGSPSLIGRAAVVMEAPSRPSYFASYLIRFRLLGPRQIRHWAGTVFASGLVRLQVRRFAATSAGQYNISQTNLAGFAIPLPPLNELDAIHAELEAAPGIDVGWPTASEVAALRQSILHAAFTGRLVPQDPADEPAAAPLARLRAAPAVSGRAPRRARPVQDVLL